MLVVAVKPQDIEPLLDELAPVIARGHPRRLAVRGPADDALTSAGCPTGIPVVRVMPNTPMVVGAGHERDLRWQVRRPTSTCKLVEELLAAVGKVARVPETQQDAVTALSGSGPAYFFYLVEAMIDAGILLGIPRDLAEPADHPVGGRRGHDARRGHRSTR